LLIGDTPLVDLLLTPSLLRDLADTEGKELAHRHHSVNNDVTSRDFLQPVDNSGSGVNSTKTTTTPTFVLAKYHSEAVPQTFTESNTISPFWSSSAVTGIRASPPQKVVREEAQSANGPRITANSATFSRCTKYRIDDFVAG